MNHGTDILARYMDAAASVRDQEREADRLQERLQKFRETDSGLVSDVVSRGKRGRKSLGTAKITGFRTEEYSRMERRLRESLAILEQKEEELYSLLCEVREFIEGVDSIEIRNILSFRYVEDMTWAQVAYAMNAIYRNRRYTKEGCEKKFRRYFGMAQK